MLKKFLFLITLINLIGINLNSSAEIIPLKKPLLSKEDAQKKLLFDIIKPLPKPIKKTEIKPEEENIAKKKEEKKPILPKKKTFSGWC